MVLIVIAGLLWLTAGLLSDYNIVLAEKLNGLYLKTLYPKIRNRKKLFYKRKINKISLIVRILSVISLSSLAVGIVLSYKG